MVEQNKSTTPGHGGATEDHAADSRPSPAASGRDGEQSSRGDAPASADLDQQTEDAKFLEREFDMTPRNASELVARDTVAPAELRDRIVHKDGRPDVSDPLAGKPVPKGPPSELTQDADEQARKPVVDIRDERQGSG
jgi:hypothetical protein